MTAHCGNFFPSEYKEFPFEEGDLLASVRSDGMYAINKILKIDQVVLKTGESICIQGVDFIAPEDDFLLVISSAYGEAQFSSLEQARQAAQSGQWTVRIGHAPNRAPGAAAQQVRIGRGEVSPAELVGYHMWKQAFERGEAGIF